MRHALADLGQLIWREYRRAGEEVDDLGGVVVEVPPMLATPHRAGTLALEVTGNEAKRAWGATKATLMRKGAPAEIPLDRWQIRYGSGEGTNFRDMPLPAMFGGPADAVTILE